MKNDKICECCGVNYENEPKYLGINDIEKERKEENITNTKERIKEIKKENNPIYDNYIIDAEKRLKNQIKSKDRKINLKRIEKHHLNFNRKNNKSENIMYLCHNCHRKTFKSEFIRQIVLPITKLETIRVIKLMHDDGYYEKIWDKNGKLYLEKLNRMRKNDNK